MPVSMNGSELAGFDERLRVVCEKTARRVPGSQLDDLRPFVCRGVPSKGSIFLVGLNPASSDRGFWEFWSGQGGFDYSAWFENYKADRVKCEKPPVSQTRSKIDVFSSAAKAAGADVLESNVYAFCAPRKRDLPMEARDNSVFKLLVAELAPRVIVAHGKDALQVIGKMFKVTLEPDSRAVEVCGTVLIGAAWHFSGQGAPIEQFNNTYVEDLARTAAALTRSR